jgi:hypothetical protein
MAFDAATIAQDAGRVTIDADRCLEIEAPDERLACFEGQVGEARANPASEPGSATVATPTASQPVRTVDVADQQQRQSGDARGELVGSIAALSFRSPNQYLVTLDNGQIWEQRIPERYLLRVGQRVRIYPSRWGKSFRLEADDLNGFIQVVRVR